MMRKKAPDSTDAITPSFLRCVLSPDSEKTTSARTNWASESSTGRPSGSAKPTPDNWRIYDKNEWRSDILNRRWYSLLTARHPLLSHTEPWRPLQTRTKLGYYQIHRHLLSYRQLCRGVELQYPNPSGVPPEPPLSCFGIITGHMSTLCRRKEVHGWKKWRWEPFGPRHWMNQLWCLAQRVYLRNRLFPVPVVS